MIVSLYECEDVFASAVKLISKLYQENNRVLIITQEIDHIDKILWQFQQLSFIPHMTAHDICNPEEQPVYITDQVALNYNNASSVVAINHAAPIKFEVERLIGCFNDNSTMHAFMDLYKIEKHFRQEFGQWVSV